MAGRVRGQRSLGARKVETASGPDPLPAAAARLDGVVIGRARQRRIDIRLAHRSIVDVGAEAYVLGAFRGVAPSGAARAIDVELDGALAEAFARRMFSCASGEVFTVPVGRTTLAASYVVILGLGGFEDFGESTLELVAENAVRALVRSKVDDFATILVGGGCGIPVPGLLKATITGFVRGLLETDVEQDFRRITLCELDATRYAQMREALLDLAATPIFEAIEVTVTELEAKAPRPPAAARNARIDPPSPTRYLYVEQLGGTVGEGPARYRVSLLDAERKAAILLDEQAIDAPRLDELLTRPGSAGFTHARLRRFGAELAKLVLPPRILEALAARSGGADQALVVLHDASASRVPWETLHVGGRFPALHGGLARRYVARDLSVAKWLESRRMGRTLDVLVIVDPTGDLAGADAEGRLVLDALEAVPDLHCTVRRRAEATRRQLLADFDSGRFDVVHYAGHAFFDARVPVRSGLVCAGGEVLSGKDVAALSRTPALFFANACESARVRGDQPKSRLHLAASFAESILRGGIAQYLGTYWPVGDEGAKTFAQVFYRQILGGTSIGRALDLARAALAAAKLVDWADYIHYGARSFRLKIAGTADPEV